MLAVDDDNESDDDDRAFLDVELDMNADGEWPISMLRRSRLACEMAELKAALESHPALVDASRKTFLSTRFILDIEKQSRQRRFL